ncbi:MULTISPECIES: tyrosine-type recombinase/integrase [Mesorhizobium]|uniref:tyrosine-type recombinase/integrase n=1 Tax=Mesorhizobium erdmanii TaxID=1777866 RepID=UPI001FCABEE7|nr:MULTISPECIES: tyrosine-type recombinase/integrase [Mesorhizobium]
MALTGRKEVNKTLGTKDPEEAKRKYIEVLAEFEADCSRIRLGAGNGEPTEKAASPAHPITDREAHSLAQTVHDEWLAKFYDNPSEQLHWHPEFYEGMWTDYPLPSTDPIPGVEGVADPIPGTMPIENIFWKSMRAGCISRAKDILVENGFPTDPWSITRTARAVGAAFQRASLTLQKLERGDYESEPQPAGLTHRSAESRPADGRSSKATTAKTKPGSATLMGLVEGWWIENKAAGRKPSTYDSYRNAFAYLADFLDHNDATKVTAKDVIGFKNHRLSTPSPKTGKMVSAKTVKDSNLSALKVVFDWGVANGLVTHNPAAGVTLKVGKTARLRSKSLSDEEAAAILSGAMAHQRGQESQRTYAAKRWIPWLCAFTGARVGELAQLRKQDVFTRDSFWIIRITPEAGTVKTNEARDVPLHEQLIELGFPKFVEQSGSGHLFLNVDPTEDSRGARRGLKNRLAEFGRSFVSDPNVAPNHGWRHRFKTVGMEAGIPPRILDAIQGQAPRTVAETYGEVTLKTMAAEIEKLPFYRLRSTSDMGSAQ